MANIHQNTTDHYQLFCRIVCPGLVLLGLILLVVSYRTTEFSCQRATGRCAITHTGILPAPSITFQLDDLTRVLVEHTDFCCSSLNPVWYNLTFELGGKKKSYQLLYAWVNSHTARELLNPVESQVVQFMDGSAVPEVLFSLPDIRREDYYCGIYFLVVGIVYGLLNNRLIFSPQTPAHADSQPGAPVSVESRTSEPIEVPLARLPDKAAPQPKLFWKPWRIGLWWAFVPSVSAFLCLSALRWIDRLMVNLSFRDSFEPYHDLFISLFPQENIYICFFLVFFVAQAWVIRRLGMSGFGWVIANVCLIFFLFFLEIIFTFYVFNDNFLSRAYSQGRLSIAALLLGSVIGMFQMLILRKRLPHAAWWLLSSATISEGLVVVYSLTIACFLRAHLWVVAIGRWQADSSRQVLLMLAFIWLFSAIQGAVLAWWAQKPSSSCNR